MSKHSFQEYKRNLRVQTLEAPSNEKLEKNQGANQNALPTDSSFLLFQ